jgi:hypothetical protein
MTENTDALTPRLLVLSHLHAEIAACADRAEKLRLLAEVRAIERDVMDLPCVGAATALAKLKFARDHLRFSAGEPDLERVINSLDGVMRWLQRQPSGAFEAE